MTAGTVSQAQTQHHEPALTGDEVARCERLYQAMETNHALIVHIDETTNRERLTVNTLAETSPLTPWSYKPNIDALRRYLRAQLAAYDHWPAEQSQEEA